MTPFFEKNAALLSPALYRAVIEADDPSIETVESKNGERVPSVTRGGRKIFVHSRFEPATEARRFVDEAVKGEHNLYIVFGFGFAYHVQALLEKIPHDSTVLIIEKEAAMLRAALECRDLSALLKDARVIVLLSPSEEKISDALKGKSSLKISFITHRGSHQINAAYYESTLELCRSFLSTKDVNIATLAKFEKIWSANIARNILPFMSAIPVKNFYGKFDGIPAIVAAAGPSLTQSLDFIRANTGKAVVIAVDTAMRILFKAGIRPHFCVAVDPQLVNARYFEGLPRSNTVLIADPTVHPSVFHMHRGPAAVTGIAFDMMKWIEKICGEKGEVTHGGSVSTNAFDLAVRLGCSSVILTGQDLSFTQGRAHAGGSYMEEQVFLKVNRLENAEMHNRRQITSMPRIKMKGIRSAEVVTNQKMMIFMSWFQKQKSGRLINATFDGMIIPGVKHADAGSLLAGDDKHDIEAIIARALKSAPGEEAVTEAAQKLKSAINEILADINPLIPLLERAKGFSANLMKLFESEKSDGGKISYILQKLDETDRILESKKTAAKDMLSLVSQKAIHTINEGYDIDSGDSGLTARLLSAKRSNYLYNEFYEGCLFNKKALETMLAIIG